MAGLALAGEVSGWRGAGRVLAAAAILPLAAAWTDISRSPRGWLGGIRGARRIWTDATLATTFVGVVVFWCLLALVDGLLPLVANSAPGLSGTASARLFGVVLAGLTLGGLMAGRLSGGRIELGLAPLGALGLGGSMLWLAVTSSTWLASSALVVLGFSGAFFALPLHALLVQRPRGAADAVAAATAVAAAGGALAGAGVAAWIVGSDPPVRPLLVWLGLATLGGSLVVLAKVPGFFLRFSLWLLTHTVYRIAIVGQPNIPNRGPALLIANHVSMIDGALVGACVQRFVRFMIYGPHYRRPVVHWLMRRLHGIPVTPGNKADVAAAIQRAHDELAAGHVACIFAEGAVSRTGNLLPFRRGFERVVAGLDVPVIPVYLDRVWGSIFSFKRGRFFWKLPERLPYPVTIAFGRPLPSTVTALEVRQAVMELGSETMRHRRPASDLLHTAFLRSAKRRFTRLALADSTGQRLTYGRALAAAMLLGSRLRRATDDEDMVGILLPASVGGALANIAVLAAGRTPVNLNFTIGPEAMAAAVGEAGIRTIVTSARFLDKAGLARLSSMVFLEDLSRGFSRWTRARALVAAWLVPAALLARRWRHGRTREAVAAVIFSSGSTGQPKGVLLTHASILANVDAIAQIFPMDASDCFIGVLPFFHSFGLTGTLWFPLLQGASVAYHPNPTDAKTIGELAAAYRGSMLITTPTFATSYSRRCTKAQFSRLKYAIVGAEKLPEATARAFEAQFGVALLEGYGCTEMSPVVAVNRPDIRHPGTTQVGSKPGSVGHAIPGVSAKVVDRETGEGPLVGQEGLLLVKGPNLMAGYLNQPERTAEVMRDGWYVTGDIAMMDEDGFIFITDRLSRFSKIGGEMVPHVRIEQAINAILGDAASVVTAVPDASRGERLVAFYTRADVTPEALWGRLAGTSLPRLWLPKKDSLFPIDAIPTLGTGKVDLRRVRELARTRVVPRPVENSGDSGVRP